MELNNNSVLYPNPLSTEENSSPSTTEEITTPKILKPIVERISTIEGTLNNYSNSFTTKDLYADYADIKELKYDYVITGGIKPTSVITPSATIDEATISDLSSEEINTETLNANEGNITDLTSTSATITNLTADEGTIDDLTTDTITAETSLTSPSATITSLTAPTLNSTNITTTNLKANTKIETPTVNATTSLTTPSATITSLSAPTLSSTDITTTNLNANTKVEAPTIKATTSLTSPSATITSLSATNVTASTKVTTPTADIDTLNTTDGTITNLTSTSADITTVNATNVNASTKVITPSAEITTSLSSPSATITTVNATNVNASTKVTVPTADITTLNATNVNASTKVTTPTAEVTTSLTSPSATITTLNATNVNVSTKVTVPTAEITTSLSSPSASITTVNATNVNASTKVEAPTVKATTSLTSPSATITSLSATNATVSSTLTASNAKVNNLTTDTPTLSNKLVGYNTQNKLIPIYMNVAEYDYVVDSQTKFNDLITLAKAHTITYKNVLIVGGKGGGTNGNYTLTVNTSTTSLYFDNANLVGFGSVKIDITSSNPNTLYLFYNGTYSNITFYTHGTIASDKTLYLLRSANIENCVIDGSNISYTIDKSTLKNTVIQRCRTFQDCNLYYCEDNSTIVPYYNACFIDNCKVNESEFTQCISPRVFVNDSSNTSKKYSFYSCGMHLDIFNPNNANTKTVNLRIYYLRTSQLTFLDKDSSHKKFNITVESADSKSILIGNNNNQYSVYKSIAQKVSKSITPSMRGKAYICIRDKSHTPIFSTDGTSFYLDESMTIPFTNYIANLPNNVYQLFSFTMNSASTPISLYDSLDFKKNIQYSSSINNTRYAQIIKISDYLCDDYVINNVRMKQYFDLGDESGTIVYSDDNGSNVYLVPDKTSKFKITKKNGTVSGTTYPLYYNDDTYSMSLNLDNSYFPSSSTNLSFSLKELPSYKDNYDVQITSVYNVPLFVQDAFYTKTKTV